MAYGMSMTDLPVKIIRSARRKRTIQASVISGSIEVRVPAGLEPSEEAKLVDEITKRVLRKMSSKEVNLTIRAAELARQYGLRTPSSVEWSSRQMKRWGSCTPVDGTIRISNRLASMPDWVLDSVLVHELAHLEVPDHGPQFEELVGRYEFIERARGYLLAKSGQTFD